MLEDLWEGVTDIVYAIFDFLADETVQLIGSTLLSLAALVCSIVALTR